MSLSTLFALSCASTIVFGNPLVNRLNVNVNDSESLSSEFDAERRRLVIDAVGTGAPGSMDYVIVSPGIFDWPICTKWDQVEYRCTKTNSNGWCPFNSYEMCHQIRGGVYHADGKCYLALSNCMGCLLRQYRDVRPDALKPVDCAKYVWFGYHFLDGKVNGQYDHQLDSVRQFVYKICVRSGSLIDGIKFYYKTPKDASNSEFIFTESPWYGGGGGGLRCFGPVDAIDRVEVKSISWGGHTGTIRSITLTAGNEVATFGGVGSDASQSVNGGVLRSVEVMHGNFINALKFNWMDGGVADDMIYETHCNGGFDC